jgi:hypothetical protein
MENKKKVKDYFMELRTLAEQANRNDLIEFVDSRIEQVDRKNASRTEKAKETQLVNVDLMNEIYDTMEEGKRYRVSEINKFDFLKDYTMNKVNYLVRGLKLDGRVSKIEEKGVAYFTKA